MSLVNGRLLLVWIIVMAIMGGSSTGVVAKTSKIQKAGKTQKAGKVSNIPVVYDKGYTIGVLGIEKLHPFDIGKYDKIAKALRRDGLMGKGNVYRPDVLSRNDLLLVHSEKYLSSLKKSSNVALYLEAPSVRYIPSFLLKSKVVAPFIKASGGTLKAARLSLKHGMAINLGGGYHHAKPNRGEGFCLIADVPIAIRKLQREGVIKRALIIDTDIHQGNGTVVCLRDDQTTYTFSMHEAGIFPVPKEVGDRDVIVPAGVTDAQYLKMLSHWLPRVLAASTPDIVFHVAGCDALVNDPLAHGRMTPNGILKRDAMVVAACKNRKVPYVMTLAGGYSKGAWKAQYQSIKSMMVQE